MNCSCAVYPMEDISLYLKYNPVQWGHCLTSELKARKCFSTIPRRLVSHVTNIYNCKRHIFYFSFGDLIQSDLVEG